jgi:hypothetical protein
MTHGCRLDQQRQRLEQGEVFLLRRTCVPPYHLKQALDEGQGRPAQCAVAARDDAELSGFERLAQRERPQAAAERRHVTQDCRAPGAHVGVLDHGLQRRHRLRAHDAARVDLRAVAREEIVHKIAQTIRCEVQDPVLVQQFVDRARLRLAVSLAHHHRRLVSEHGLAGELLRACGGFSFGGTYSFSNDTGFANNRALSVGAQYTTGGWLIAAAYLNANNPALTSGGAIAGESSTNGTDDNFAASRLQIFGAGVNYTAGPATVGFAYSNTYIAQPVANVGYLTGDETIQPVTGPLAGGRVTSLRYQNFEVNGKYQFTPACFVGAQYVYTLERYDATTGSVKPAIHSVGLMVDYNLSKRTDVYLQGAFQLVAGDRTGSSLDQAYVPGAQDLSSTSRQLAVRAAIRHSF